MLSQIVSESSQGSVQLPFSITNSLERTESGRLYRITGILTGFVLRENGLYGRASILKEEVRDEGTIKNLLHKLMGPVYDFTTIPEYVEGQSIPIFPEKEYRTELKRKARSVGILFKDDFLDEVFSPLDAQVEQFMN
ncbi:MAG: hypothetical protein ABIJ21_02530 [Nanoarchaeota archaeon]